MSEMAQRLILIHDCASAGGVGLRTRVFRKLFESLWSMRRGATVGQGLYTCAGHHRDGGGERVGFSA